MNGVQNEDFEEPEIPWQLKVAMQNSMSKRHSMKVREGIRSAVQRGTYLGRKVRYGHRIIRKAGFLGKSSPALEIEPAQAEVVRIIFEMRDNGILEAEIATYLNKNKIPPPKGSRWNRTMVDRILDDSIYCGIYTMNRKDPEKRIRFFDSTPEIVSPELFYRVRGKRDGGQM